MKNKGITLILLKHIKLIWYSILIWKENIEKKNSFQTLSPILCYDCALLDGCSFWNVSKFIESLWILYCDGIEYVLILIWKFTNCFYFFLFFFNNLIWKNEIWILNKFFDKYLMVNHDVFLVNRNENVIDYTNYTFNKTENSLNLRKKQN